MSTLTWFLAGTFKSLSTASVQAGGLIVVVLALRGLLGRRLPGRWLHAMWLVVLIRLVLPWTPSADWSPRALLPALVGTPAAGMHTHLPVRGRPENGGAPHQADSTAWSLVRMDDGAAGPGLAGRASLWHGLCAFWLAGSVVLFGYVAVKCQRLSRRVGGEPPVADPRVLKLLEECRRAMGIGAEVRLIATDSAGSPALMGFLRPRLLMPPRLLDTLDESELRHVFLHELAHLRRHDVLIGWIACLIQMLHWCNPLVWLAAGRMRADRELACDALAIGVLGEKAARGYGQTILKLLEQCSRPQHVPALTGILEDQSQLKRRIAMIARFNPRNERMWAPGLSCLLLLGAIGLTEAPAGTPETSGAGQPIAEKRDPGLAPANRPAGGGGRAMERLSEKDLPEGSRIDEKGNIVDRTDWPFVDDPAVLGKWESVDYVRKVDDFTPGKPAARKLFLKGMVFEKDGKANYGFLKWTRGKVIHAGDKTASEYVIREVEGVPHLFMQWKSGDYTIRHRRPWYYVLKKLPADSPKLANARELLDLDREWPEAKLGPNSHIDAKGHIVDKIDYPFVSDPDVIGTWKGVDFVNDKKQFVPGKQYWKADLFLKEMVFQPDGKIGPRGSATWTKGLVLHPKDQTASAYEIVERDGGTYLFFEWKSGDYKVLHRRPAYYVLKKAASESER